MIFSRLIRDPFSLKVSSLGQIRHYRPGDEEHLVALWNLAYARYGGYVPRTVEYWQWCLLERPGVTTQDIFILEHAADVLAYGVLGPDGCVLELAVNPNLSTRKQTKAVNALQTALEQRSRLRGDETIQFLVPHTNEPICRALRLAGYSEEATESLNMTIVDPAGLIKRILQHRVAQIPASWSPTFLLKIKPGYYRFSPCSRLCIQIGTPVIIDDSPVVEKADFTVDSDLSTLTDLIFKRTTFEEAVHSGCITVWPVSGIRDVGNLMSLLALECLWYTPVADGR